jgi:hypothetical protein
MSRIARPHWQHGHWGCSNAFWLSRFGRVVPDFKRHAGNVAAFVPLAQVRIMLQRLTASSRHEFKLAKLSAFMRARRMAQSSIFLRRVGRTFG